MSIRPWALINGVAEVCQAEWEKTAVCDVGMWSKGPEVTKSVGWIVNLVEGSCHLGNPIT